jgi:hypothetical protein
MKEMDQAYARVASALFDETKRQQGDVTQLIRRLNAAVVALETSTAAMPATLAEEVKSTLSEAARTAASEMTRSWTEANRHAELATKAYRRETTRGPRKLMLINFVSIIVGVAASLTVAWFFVPDEKYVAQLRAEQAQLEQNIRNLEASGARAQFRSCQVSKRKTRICVQVDESLVYGDGYRLLR